MSENKRLSPETSKQVIDALGGTFNVAELFGVTAAAVSMWKTAGMPKARVMYLREKYKRLPIMKSSEVRSV